MNRTQFTGLLGGLMLMLGAQVASAACTITPLHSVVNAGESVALTASCSGDVTTISWTMDNQAATSPASLNYNLTAGQNFYLHTPSNLASGVHIYNVNVTPTDDAGSGVDVVMQSATLNVGTTGPGSGSVASSPVGISCPTTCSNSSFDNGEMVTLSATPASGSSFAGWSGDCTGNGACTVVMTGNRNVTASFDNAPQRGVCASLAGLTDQPSANQACSVGTYVAGNTGTSVTWTCNGVNGGDAASCTAPRAFTVTPSADANGTVSPSTPQTVAYGQTLTFRAGPDTTHTNYSATFSGCPGTANGYSFTTSSTLSADCTLAVSFSNTPVNGVCGSANSTTKPLLAQPTTGQCSAGTYAAGANTSQSVPWTCTGSNGGSDALCSAPHGYTVTASAGQNGSINPSSQTVAYNTAATFTVGANSGYMASVSGCNGSLAGSTYTTGSIAGDCSVTASFAVQSASATDPGQWTGLWLPPGTNNVFVADQMSPRGVGSTNYIPGCLNEQTSSGTPSGGDCSAKVTYTGIVYGTGSSATVALQNNNILSIRYKSNSNPNTTYSSFLLVGGSGGNLGTTVNMWLSTTPGAAMSSVPTYCKSTSSSSVRVSTNASWCSIKPDTNYYLNIQVPATVCSFCSFKLTDDTQFN